MFRILIAIILLLQLSTNLSFGQVSEVSVQVNWVNWASDNGLSVYAPDGTLLLFVCDPTNCQNTATNSSYSNTFNLGCYPDLSNYYIVAEDAFGDGWNGTGNFVRVFSGGTQVLNYNLTSGSTSGQQFFTVSGGGTCPTIDAGIDLVTGPTLGCGLTNNETVSVTIRNQGTDPIAVVPVTFSINGGNTQVAGEYSGSIAAGDTGIFNFNVDVSTEGIYDFEIAVDAAGDVNAINDVYSTFSITNSTPYDFVTQGPYFIGFEADENLTGWSTQNYNNDAGIWTLNGTTNPRTGSQAAIYNYNTINAANDWFFSKCLTLEAGSSYDLEFFYRVQSGAYPEGFAVRITSAADNISTISTIQSFTNITNTTYAQSTNTFTVPSTGEYYLAFEATSIADRWNIIIDDITISKVVPVDVGVVSINSPGDGCGLTSTETVNVTIENFGTSSVSNIPLEYSIDGQPYQSAGISVGTLFPGVTSTYNFTADFSGLGAHTVSVRTALATDGITGNNEATTTITNITANLTETTVAMGFEAAEDFGQWTILNQNGDNRQWEITTVNPNTGSQAVRIRQSNNGLASNDWLFTPCTYFEVGETYVIDFSFRARNANFLENMQVLLTSNTDAVSTVSTINTYTGFNNNSYKNQALEFTVPSSGIYYIAFRSTSAGNQRGIQIDDVDIYNKTSYWLGYSTDWNDPNNWSAGIAAPNADITVSFPPVGGNMPIVSGIESINNLTIETGSTINFTASGGLKVSGDYVGSTVFTDGEITFNGSSLQQISGTNTFSTLSLNNASGLKVNLGNQNISKELWLIDGVLDLGTNILTIESNASGDARIAPVTNGSISGNVTVERYIDAGATNWRYLCTPIVGANFEEWDNDIITSGFVGSDYPTFNFTSIYSYNESAPGAFDDGYVPLSNSNEIIELGTGYMVWSGSNGAGTSAFTLDVTGPVNLGPTNLNVSYTNTGDAIGDGWTLVGNPYASTINWDTAGWVKTNINDAIYVWDPDASQYASYVAGVGVNGGSKYIPSGQSFWVQATGVSPVLTATENIKSNSSRGFLKPAEMPSNNPLIKLQVKNSSYKDEMVVRFIDEASTAFDKGKDALKVNSSSPYVPKMYSTTDSTNYSINSLPKTDSLIVIPISTKVGFNGNYKLNLISLQDFEDAACILLEDLLTGEVYNLKAFSTATIAMNTQDVQPRFELSIYPSLTKTLENATCFNDENGKATYTTIHPNFLSNLYLKDNLQQVVESINGNIADSTIVFDNLSTGLYFVSAQTTASCPSIRDTFRINSPSEITAQFEANKSSNHFTYEFTNYSTGGYVYEWNFGDNTTSTENAPTHTFNKSGEYLVSLRASNKYACDDEFTTKIIIENQVVEAETDNIKTLGINDLTAKNIEVITNGKVVQINFLSSTFESQIEILNIQGALVYSEHIGSTSSHQINLQQLASAVYVLNIRTNGEQFTEKIVLQ